MNENAFLVLVFNGRGTEVVVDPPRRPGEPATPRLFSSYDEALERAQLVGRDLVRRGAEPWTWAATKGLIPIAHGPMAWVVKVVYE